MANLVGESADPKVPAVVAKHTTNGIGVKASAGAGGCAGEFDGNVKVNGNLSVDGLASIDKNAILLTQSQTGAYSIGIDGENSKIAFEKGIDPGKNDYTIVLDGRNNKIDMGKVHIDGNNGKYSVDGLASIDKNAILLSQSQTGAYSIALDGENSKIQFEKGIDPGKTDYTILLDGRNNRIDMGGVHIDGNAGDINSNGNVFINGGDTSQKKGSIHVSGAAYVAKDINIGGNDNVQGDINANGNIKAKGSLSVGQASIDKNVILLAQSQTGAYSIALDGENSKIQFEKGIDPGKTDYTILLDGRNNRIDMGKVHIDGNNGKYSVDGLASIDKNAILLSQSQTGAYSIALDGENSKIQFEKGIDPGETDYTILLDGRNNRIDMGGVHIDGNAGDISLDNADCAEDFEVLAGESVEAGTVMALNDAGQLEKCIQPYDKRVAGVVSGAGNLKPGLILGRQAGHTGKLPIALMGRVHCKVDANYGAIEVGDLLTSSVTPGYAMKANDPARSFGAVIGKALKPLKDGRDLIPILVALQ